MPRFFVQFSILLRCLPCLGGIRLEEETALCAVRENEPCRWFCRPVNIEETIETLVRKAVREALAEQVVAPPVDLAADLDLLRVYPAREAADILGLRTSGVYRIPEAELPKTRTGPVRGSVGYLGLQLLRYIAGLPPADVERVAQEATERTRRKNGRPVAETPQDHGNDLDESLKAFEDRLVMRLQVKMMASHLGDDYVLDEEEAARLLGVSRRTMQNLRTVGEIRCGFIAGSPRYSLGMIRALMREIGEGRSVSSEVY